MNTPNPVRPVSGTISAVRRLPATAAGNPRWEIELDGKAYRTEPDAQCNYLLPDPRLQPGCTCTLQVDKTDAIRFIYIDEKYNRA